MGRHKKEKIPALPSSPVKLADALLFAEDEIRQTVSDERQALSLIGNSNPDGNAGGRGQTYTDRTAAAAVKLAEGLSCVVLDDGRTVKKPEKWLAIFDEVRKRAAGCQRPELILETWRAWYGQESRFVSADLTPEVWRNVRKWIRYQVLTEAKDAGLVAFEEDEVIEDIEAAEDWKLCD